MAGKIVDMSAIKQIFQMHSCVNSKDLADMLPHSLKEQKII
jgi:hypothetical protein